MSIELEELLARATALEEKAAAALAAKAAPAVSEPVPDGDRALVAALEAKIAQLEDTFELLTDSSAPGVDPIADFEAGDGPDPAAAVTPVEPEEAEGSWLAAVAELEGDFGDDDEQEEAVGQDFPSADPAELADLADQLDAEADADDEKGFDFDDWEEKGADTFVRDPIGRFATTPGDKKDPEKDPQKTANDYQVETLDDVRRLMRDWKDIPMSARAGLKAKMAAVVAKHSSDAHEHQRLTALVGGLGDGDGKAEAGEGSAAAFASGHADEWLAEHQHDAPAKKPAAHSSSSSGSGASAGGSGSGSGGKPTEGGGSNEGGKPLPKDPEQYRVNNAADVRDLAASWPDVPMAARKRLKQRLLHALADDPKHDRLRKLVHGLGNGDGKAEAGEGAGAAMAAGHADQWLAKHGGKKSDDLDLEEKSALDGTEFLQGDYVALDEMELLQARRAQLGI